jgi:hypothetical protein
MTALPLLKSGVGVSLKRALMMRMRLSEFSSSGSGPSVSISRVCGAGAVSALMLRV